MKISPGLLFVVGFVANSPAASAQISCLGEISGERPAPGISNPVIDRFSKNILGQRGGSFWNKYYSDACAYVRTNLKAALGVDADVDPVRVVEIGTAWGGNADFIGRQFRKADVIAVDPLAPDYDPDDTQSRTVTSIFQGLNPAAAGDAWADALLLDAHRPSGPGCRYHLLKNFSHDAAALLGAALGPGSVEYLFIDGLHTYEGVVRDIRDYVSLVKRGGVIVFNDYGTTTNGKPNAKPMFPGVTQAVDEFVAAQRPPLRLEVGSLGKPPGVSNAGIAIPLDWEPVLSWAPTVALEVAAPTGPNQSGKRHNRNGPEAKGRGGVRGGHPGQGGHHKS